MPDYLYVAQTNSGAIERGRICGSAPAEAKAKLSQQGKRLVSIQALENRGLTLQRYFASIRCRRFQSVRSTDIELMLQQLAVMLGGGLELTASLRELSVHSPKRCQQQLCTAIAEKVEQGNSFATAISEARSFPTFIAQLVHVGEKTGQLAVTLQRAAEFIESRRQARSELLAALAYPLLVAIAACFVASYLVGWAIPQLATFLHALGRKLPAMTQSLVDISELFQKHGPLCIVALATSAAVMVMLYFWKPGRYRIDQWQLHLPLIGPLMQMAETHQLASALALMLRSGVFLPEALKTAASLHRNQFLAAKVSRSHEELANGKDLAGLFAGPGFGPMLASMIAVGEKTGDLPKSLEHVSKFYAAQLEGKLKRFSRLIEPTIIVIVGGVVGYVYVAFFMALLSAGGNFK